MDILLRVPGGFPETHTHSGEKRFLLELSCRKAASVSVKARCDHLNTHDFI